MTNLSCHRSHTQLVAISTAFALALGLASPAQAGPVEQLTAMAQHPTDSQVLVLRYENGTGGLLFSRDGGATFRIHPSRAFTDFLQGNVALSFTGNGRLLLGLFAGLARDDGQGCNIQEDPALQSWVTSIARNPSDPNVAFVLTTGGSSGARTGLWEHNAAGVVSALSGNDTGTTMGTPDFNKPIFLAKSLRVLARGEEAQLRFVEVGNKTANNADPSQTVRTPTFRYSDDRGASWTEHPLAGVDPFDDTVLIAVTADEPMKVVIAVQKTGAQDPLDSLLLSTDGGQTFSPYIDGITKVGQSLVTPDGRLYIADKGPGDCGMPAGLWSAPQVGAPAERITDFPVQCLGYDASRSALYLCKDYELGLFYPAERAYCRLFKMNDTADFVSCDPSLGENETVDSQLCGDWCGQVHYASSGVCEQTSCVEEARAYDLQAGWIEPPGRPAPSCTGFVPSEAGATNGGGAPGCESDGGVDAGADGGVPPNNDAGELPGPDGAVVAPGSDGGTPAPTPDGGLDASSPAADGAIDPGEGDQPGGDGCDCSVRSGRTAPPDLTALGLALWLLGRGLRRQKRSQDRA